MTTAIRFFLLAMVPTAAMATATSVEIFPSLRKRKLAAAQKRAEELQEQDPVDSGPVAPVQNEASATVPAAVDMGSDGFPQLPAVSKMLSGASGTLKTVSSQASGLEARLVQAQMQSESKMAKEKAAFEEKLKQQEKNNRLIIQANDNITAEIKSLQGSNADLKKHAHEIEQDNHLMRSELHQLSSRLGVAQDFAAKSLTKTDDSKNLLLQVLHGRPSRNRKAFVQTSTKASDEADDDDDDDDEEEEGGSDEKDNSNTKDAKGNSDNKDHSNGKDSTDTKDTSDDDDEDDDSEDSDGGTASFLSLSMKVHRASKASGTVSSFSFDAAMADLETTVPAVTSSAPGDLLGDLMRDVAHLAEQEKQSEKTLKTLFIRDFRAGAKRRTALLAQQKNLAATRSSLLDLQAKLKKADAHLEATHSLLKSKLHGIGQFLQKLAHFTMAPQQDAKHLMAVLPKVVTVKENAV